MVRADSMTLGGGTCPLSRLMGRIVFYALERNGKYHLENSVAGGDAVTNDGSHCQGSCFVVSMKGIYYVSPPESPTRQLIQFLDFANKFRSGLLLLRTAKSVWVWAFRRTVVF
jgi:hypothetical protein